MITTPSELSRVSLLLAVLVGVGLRLWQLPEQVVADDEWHAVTVAVNQGYGWILTHFGEADHSIGLAVLEKALLSSVGLTELTLRLPSMVAGCVSLLLFPLLLPPEVAGRTRSIFAWLMAVAPMHVYMSRNARPYAMTVLAAFVGIVAFARWWNDGSARSGGGYVACVVLSSYFHLTALPALAAPVMCAFAERVGRRARSKHRDERVPLATLALLAALGVGMVVAPPLWFDSAALRMKAGSGRLDAHSVWSALELVAGATNGLMALAVALTAAVGLGLLWRRESKFTGCLIAAAVLSLVTTLLARPAYVQVPVVFARYNAVLLPIVLLSLAAALNHVDEWTSTRARWIPRGLCTALLTAVMVLFGPLPRIYRSPNNWTNHAVFQYTYDSVSPYAYGPALMPSSVPSFYQQLSRHRPGELLLMEAPWYLAWHYNLQPFYQEVHRQRTVIGLGDGQYPYTPGREILSVPGIAFKLFVDPADELSVCRLGVDYAVFHRDLQTEMARGEAPPLDVTGWLELYRRRYGRPVFTDDKITVFAVGEAACGRR